MNQFTEVCLSTFILFFGYWLFVAIANKAQKARRKSASQAPPLFNHSEAHIQSIDEMGKEPVIKTNNDFDVQLSPSTQKESKIGSYNFGQGFQDEDSQNETFIGSHLKERCLPVIEESFQQEDSYLEGNTLENSAETSGLLALPQKDNHFCNEDRNTTQISSLQNKENRELEKFDNFKEYMKGTDEARVEINKQNWPFVEIKQNQHEPQLKQDLKQNMISSIRQKDLAHHGASSHIPNHQDSSHNTLQDQILQYRIENEHLRNEIGQARSQIKRLEESESDQKRYIEHLQKEISKTNKANRKANVMYVRSKQPPIQGQTNENLNIQVNVDDAKEKMTKAHKKSKVYVQENEDKGNKNNAIQNSHLSSLTSKPIEKNQKKVGYRFLSDCCFVTSQDKEFLYGNLQSLFDGNLKTQKFYNSKQNSSKNPHAFIDNIRNILLIIELENGKLIGAYTQCAFTHLAPHSISENIAFLFDISNMKSFKNETGKNSINYSINCVTWGMDQLTVSFERANELMTHFGRDGGIFWDGEYKREDLVGVDRDWVGINQYELYRVTAQ